MQGDSLKISPVVILFSLLFWGWLWGIVGLFLAVPLTVALKIVFEHIPGYEFVGVLMGRTANEEDLVSHEGVMASSVHSGRQHRGAEPGPAGGVRDTPEDRGIDNE
jgi:hypothetical protein